MLKKTILVAVAFQFISPNPILAQPGEEIVNTPVDMGYSDRVSTKKAMTGNAGSLGYGSGIGSSYGSYRSSGSTYNYEEVPELNVTLESEKQYDTLVAKVERKLRAEGAIINRENEEYSYRNHKEKRFIFNANISKAGFQTVKDHLNLFEGRYEFRITTQRQSFMDTARAQEELKLYMREKNALSKLLDTMNPTNPYYRTTNQNLLNLISTIASRQNELRDGIQKIKSPCKITVTIYTNYSKYHETTNSGNGYDGNDNGYRSKSSYSPSWQRNIIPGISYLAFNPAKKDSFGIYSGFAPEFSLHTRYRGRNNSSNPSISNVYARLGILKSENKTETKIYYSALGVRLSFENRLKRNYLIPFFGDEFSYAYKESEGGALLNIPQAGIYLFFNKNLQASFSAGYIYPFGKRSTYTGYTISGSLSFLLWK